MKKNISFSILIPCYNCQRTIDRCLNSIFNQTYTNYKIYVYDDGSKDNTINILNEYKQNGKIHFLKCGMVNKSSVVGRKQLLKQAQQDYCLFVDSDDQITNSCLQTYVNIINQYPLDIIITDFQVNQIGNFAFTNSDADKQVILYDNVFDYSFYLCHYFLMWNKCIKTSLAHKINVPDVYVYGCDDHMFTLQLYLFAQSLGVFRTTTNYIYNYGSGQFGSQLNEEKMRKFCAGYKDTILYNFNLIVNNNLDKRYFNWVYQRYNADYLQILSNNRPQLLQIYSQYFNNQFYDQLNKIVMNYK